MGRFTELFLERTNVEVDHKPGTLVKSHAGNTGRESWIWRTGKSEDGKRTIHGDKKYIVKHHDEEGNHLKHLDQHTDHHHEANHMARVFAHSKEPLPKDESYQLIEGLRKVGEYHDETSGRKATVHKDTEWEEHVVRFHTNGKHHKNADYHTSGDDDNGKKDAHDTAQHWVKHGPPGKTNESLQEGTSKAGGKLFGRKVTDVHGAVYTKHDGHEVWTDHSEHNRIQNMKDGDSIHAHHVHVDTKAEKHTSTHHASKISRHGDDIHFHDTKGDVIGKAKRTSFSV